VSISDYRVGEKNIMLIQSGMGPVNAALSLAIVLEYRKVDAIILLGVGGSISPDLKIGDAVISKKVLQHDYFSSLDFGNPRMAAGHIILSEKDLLGHTATISADTELIEQISKSIAKEHLFLGTVVSGNEFVGTVKRKLELQSLDPEALLVDMEAAGVAQVAKRTGVPFVVVKTVADRLHVDGSIESDFRASLELAALNASNVLRKVLES
jgi:5'-methylthioadenosine/S-adenosylhomocysteine nucleosidase